RALPGPLWRARLDAYTDRFCNAVSRDDRGLPVGAPETPDDVSGADGGVFLRFLEYASVPTRTGSGVVSLRVLPGGHADRPRVAQGERLSAYKGEVSVMGHRGDVHLQCGDHTHTLFCRSNYVPDPFGADAERPCGGAVRLVSAQLFRDRRGLLSRGERALHAVSRPQSSVGSRHACRLLRRADHLSDRCASRTVALLPVSLAADAGDSVRAERAGG